MHIAFVTTTYPPQNGWGGIGSYVYHMARGLTGLGHSVTVLCGCAVQPSQSHDEGIHVIRCLDGGPAPVSFQVLKQLEALIWHDPVDVVEFPEHDALGLEFQRRYPDFPVVVKLHGDSELCFRGRAPWWKRLAAELYLPAELRGWIRLQRETVRRAHIVVAPSSWSLEQWRRRHWSLPLITEVIPNSFSGWSGDDLWARSYRDHKVLWLGRLDRLKGVHLLPAIARLLWRRFPDAEIHVVGQSPGGHDPDVHGRILRELPRAHQKQLVFLGGLPYPHLLRMLNEYSIAVFASAWETFSYTQLECMWAGIACVSASGSGSAELGTDGEHLLACRRHPADIARQLERVLGDPVLRERLGKAARSHVLERFNSRTVARAMSAVYARAVYSAGTRLEPMIRPTPSVVH